MPTVSIIIPTYNRANYLKEGILSILNQGFTDFEIIISDNASTDNTFDVVNSISDKRIIYNRNITNAGITANYNIALKMCKGKYIHIFSDDDIMSDGCIAEKVAILDNYNSVGLVHSDVMIIDSAGEIKSDEHFGKSIWKKWGTVHNTSKLFPKREYHKYLYYIHNLVVMPSVMIRRSVIDQIGYFNPNVTFIIDWDYWLKTTLFFDVYYIDRKLILYRLHEKNITYNNKHLLAVEVNTMITDLHTNFSSQAFLKESWLLSLLRETKYYSHYNLTATFKSFIKKYILKNKML